MSEAENGPGLSVDGGPDVLGDELDFDLTRGLPVGIPEGWRRDSKDRIATRAQVQPLTDPRVYSTYTQEDLVQVSGTDPSNVTYLHPYAAFAFEQLRRTGEADGFRFRIWSGWRSWQLQSRAYQYFQRTGLNLAGKPVPSIAHPCLSKHPTGLALDLSLRPRSSLLRWLIDNAATFGFEMTRSDEPWEWQFVGVEEPTPPDETPPVGGLVRGLPGR